MVMPAPFGEKSAYIHKALANGYPVAVLEEGSVGRWIKRRYVGMVSWIPEYIPATNRNNEIK